MNNAIVYARVSTAEQATSGLGIAAQIERCRAYTEPRGIVAREVQENGVSGTLPLEQRPALGPILAELDSGQANMLIVAKLDRIGRDVRDVLNLTERAKNKGWGLVILDLDIDTTTANGWMILSMLAVLAEWERNIIAERTRIALAAKKAQGARGFKGRADVLTYSAPPRPGKAHEPVCKVRGGRSRTDRATAGGSAAECAFDAHAPSCGRPMSRGRQARAPFAMSRSRPGAARNGGRAATYAGGCSPGSAAA